MDNDVRWLYADRVEIWAKNVSDALTVLRYHGFTNPNPKLLKLVEKAPQDIIADTEIHK